MARRAAALQDLTPAALRSAALAVTLAAATFLALPVGAHPFSVSAARALIHGDRFSIALELDVFTALQLFHRELDRDADGRLSAAEVEASRAALGRYLSETVSVTNDQGSCRSDTPAIVSLGGADRIRARLDFVCDAPWGVVSWTHTPLMEDVGGHRHAAELRLLGHVERRWFTPGDSKWTFDATGAADAADDLGPVWLSPDEGRAPAQERAAAPTAPTSAPPPSMPTFAAFVPQGVLHVLGGLDHVLFLVAVLIVVRSLRELVLLVSSFTLAHSITLALGAVGGVDIAPRFVESLIALSLVYVALENVLRSEPSERHALTFAFGLVHGFGFAGVLKELGLPPERAFPPLLGFNAGVELGQLILVVPLFLVLRLASAHERKMVALRRTVSGLIAAMGAFWFFQRAFGG